MNYYKAKEYPKHQVPEKLAIDGTIMFNIARRDGLNVEFPKDYIDHYIDLGKGNNKARHSGTVKNIIGV
jgi:stringent starvation protein B